MTAVICKGPHYAADGDAQRRCNLHVEEMCETFLVSLDATETIAKRPNDSIPTTSLNSIGACWGASMHASVKITDTARSHDMPFRANSFSIHARDHTSPPWTSATDSTMPSCRYAQSAKGPEATGSQGHGTHQR